MTGPASAPDPRPVLVLLVGSLGVGGAERHMLSLAHGLADVMRVVLVYIKDDDPLRDQVDLDRVDEMVCLGAGPGWDRAAVRRLRELLDRVQADVVLCANLYPLAYGRAASRDVCPRPRVIEVFHTTQPDGLRARLKVLRYLPLVWSTYRVVYVCHAQRTYWRRRGMWPRRSTVIHNGVDTDHFDRQAQVPVAVGRADLGFSEGDLVIGLCAAMRPEKAHTLLLDAISLVDRRGGPPWHALLIGDGPERTAIERHAASLGLTDRVVITGVRSDVRAHLALCDVMSVVSVTETFSIAALEAMSMGRALVMSDVGGAREQVVPGRTGWLFPVGDAETLARCLVEASDRDRLAHLGAAARARVVQLFALPLMLRRYGDVLAADVTSRRIQGSR